MSRASSRSGAWWSRSHLNFHSFVARAGPSVSQDEDEDERRGSNYFLEISYYLKLRPVLK